MRGAPRLWQREFVYLVPVFCSQTRRGANRKCIFGANKLAPPSPGDRASANTRTPDTLISDHKTLPSHLSRPARWSGMRWCPSVVAEPRPVRGAPRGTG